MRTSEYLWDALVTVHWFVTGTYIMEESTDPTTHEIYNWYLQIESSAPYTCLHKGS